MTEVPEHLLRRSRERREALGLAGSGDEGGSGGDEAAPAPAPVPATAAAEDVVEQPAAVAVPAVAEPEAEPEPTYIRPDPGRSKNPLWVMPVLVGFPLWVIFYLGALHPPKKSGPVDPLVLGEQVFHSAGCSGCHGANGEGGVGPALHGGQAKLTFPNIADHVSWVKTGSGPFAGQKYGDPARPGGQHGPATGGMPAFGSTLSDAQINAVVQYEREKL